MQYVVYRGASGAGRQNNRDVCQSSSSNDP
jgi:hypothetical protein